MEDPLACTSSSVNTLLPSRVPSASVTSNLSQLSFPSAVCSWEGRAVPLREGANLTAFPVQPLTHRMETLCRWQSICSEEARAQLRWGTQSRAGPCYTGWFLTGYWLMPHTHHDATHPECNFISFIIGIFFRLFFPVFGVFLSHIL